MNKTVADMKDELEVASKINRRNWQKVEKSSNPEIDKVFALSSAKRCAVLKRKLGELENEH